LPGAGVGHPRVLRARGQDELTLLGRCIGGTLCLIHGGIYDDSPARNIVLLTTPADTRRSLYADWVGRDWFDVDYVADRYEAVPGAQIDWVNNMMKPVTNYWTTYRRLWENVLNGEIRREAYQRESRNGNSSGP